MFYTLPPKHLTEEQIVIISAAYKECTVSMSHWLSFFYIVSIV